MLNNAEHDNTEFLTAILQCVISFLGIKGCFPYMHSISAADKKQLPH